MLARRNVEAFKRTGAKYIVTACASCASTLRAEYRGVLGPEAEPLSGSLLELSEFLDRVGFAPDQKLDESVTYHDPCHLAWVLGVKEAPRRLIRRSAELVEMEDADRCCGMGGVFASMNPGVADEIGLRKVNAAAGTGVPTLVSTCPGCMMQIEGQLRKRDVAIRVEHLAELLLRACQ